MSRQKSSKWTRELGWRTIVGALLLGGVIHIGATFAVPVLGSDTAFQRLKDTLPANRMTVLPPATPDGQLLPFLIGDALFAMCRYDLAAGPIIVSAVLADAGWALSLHSPQGDNFYVMPAQQLRRNEVTLAIVPSGDRVADAALVAARASGPETQIASPSTQGLVVVRAPLRGVAWRSETEAVLRRASCIPARR